jgi:glycosyltransferase involved in cell wall biosynthesis
VLAAQDGPLRPEFEALGAHITLVDVRPLFGAHDEEMFHARLADIKHSLDWEQIDLVVCNTLMNFWGVPLAARADKPSLLYIHESTSIRRFFWDSLDHRLHHLVGEALEGATRALFLCPATQAYYEAHGRNGNFRIVPSWVRLEDIAAFRAAHPREETRRRLGYAEDEVVIANIGTVCERKGQHIFLRAIDHFVHHHPQVKARFVLLGARPGIYLDLLQRDLARLNLPHVTLVPETREGLRALRGGRPVRMHQLRRVATPGGDGGHGLPDPDCLHRRARHPHPGRPAAGRLPRAPWRSHRPLAHDVDMPGQGTQRKVPHAGGLLPGAARA